MNVFISHITEEAPIALALKDFIAESFLGKISVFVSSDPKDLLIGENWLEKIPEAMKKSKVFLICCSPLSLTRPWINFEAGCGWMTGEKVIPICYLGQLKNQLPFPLIARQALEIEAKDFGDSLLETLSESFDSRKPRYDPKELRQKLKKAIAEIGDTSSDITSPMMITSQKERTKWIIKDLKKLLKSGRCRSETVWSSAFLSTLAIGPEDPYSEEDADYLKLLLIEKKLLLDLARKGCNIKFIISPANENHIKHAGIEYAIMRTERILNFLNSSDSALENIDWAISELGIKNLYIIGHISLLEGYKKGIHHGYALTLRQTALDVININIDVYHSFFEDLAARGLTKWAANIVSYNKRELLRIAAIKCIQDSLKYLHELKNKPKP